RRSLFTFDARSALCRARVPARDPASFPTRRSADLEAFVLARRGGQPPPEGGAVDVEVGEQADSPADRLGAPAVLGSVGRQRHRRARKSTRLNSSHVSISYAVFC